MGTPNDELKAQMKAEMEAAIEQLLARKKPAEDITLTEIEDLVMEARQEIEKRLTQILVESSRSYRGQLAPNAAKRCITRG